MKKISALVLSAVMALSMTACGTTTTSQSSSSEKSVTISVENATNEMIDISVPVNPQRIVVADYVALDMLDSWGLGDKIVGLTKDGVPTYLSKYKDNDNIKNIGSLKEVDMEAIMELEPDLIFTSGRLGSKYDEFSKIAPTVKTSIDYKKGFLNSFSELTKRNASIFELDEKADKQLASFNDRIEKIKEASKDKTAIVGITTGGSLTTLGNDSRCSIIGTDLGFKNLADSKNSTHGNNSSFELLVDLDADYIFILDRDTAIAADGAVAAQQLMDNELVHKTKAHQNGNIVYLTPAVWYMSEGGITAMDIMLKDIEQGVLK